MANWPKSFLLAIFKSAVANGHTYVDDITEEEALSISMSMKRMVRRIDTSARSYILPEFYIVTPLNWIFTHEDEGRKLGRLPISYAGDMPTLILPKIFDPQGRMVPVTVPEHPSPAPEPVDELHIGPSDIEKYVKSLTKRIEK